MMIINFSIRTPAKVYDEYNKMLMTMNPHDIDKYWILKKKKWRYLFALTFALVCHFVAWYYVTVFCSVYTKSSVSWICGGLISLVIKYFIVQPTIPLIKGLFRWMTYRYKKK